MKRILLVFSALYLSIVVSSFSQSVPFPAEPPYNTMAPWGYTQAGTNWNTATYLPFKYQGIWFRLMLPNGVTYNANTNTFTNSNPSVKYPMIVFNTGAGERGTDNNKQLLHGGQVHQQAVLSGRFPGFLVYWQTENGFLDSDKMLSLVNKLIATIPVDIDRIYTHGLSRGGKNTWDYLRDMPKVWAAAFPMSAASNTFYHQQQVHIPVRLSQGGLDTNPMPSDGDALYAEYVEHGGNMGYYFFPTLGHGTWNTCYALPDFFEWFLAQKKNQIHVFFLKKEVCPGDPVNIRLGMTGGFDGYEWMKDGVLIPGTTNQNEIVATSFGSYTARFRRGTTWTAWSAPVVIKVKDPTQTPAITTNGLRSIVLPAPDGSTTVSLQEPTGYVEYSWKNASNAVIGTARTISVGVGTYTATVREDGGCSSLASAPFTVIDANGPNAPDPINNLRISPQGLTALELNWENNPTPVNNETGFEIYRSESDAGPFTLVKITAADVLTYVDQGLQSSKAYSYIVRAVNGTGASIPSDVTTATTGLDTSPPTVPGTLSLQGFTPTSVSLRWSSSTDNVGVVGYDVYANGVKAYVVAPTNGTINFTVNGLITNTTYNFVVKARDAAGNSSAPTNQVTQNTTGSGLNYKFYIGSFTAVPDFGTLTPSKVGWISNFSISARTQTDNFGFRYTGKLRITNPGNYTFYTRSDDGSKMYLNGALIVNNDGLHGQVEVASSQMNLAVGVYDIMVDYFDATGGDGITVSWSKTSPNSIFKQSIPSSAFTDVYTPPAAPATPAGLVITTVDYQGLNVAWTPYAGTGTQIEIQRSTNNSTWANVMTVPASQSAWVNNGLNPNTRYYYRIRAVGTNGESAYTSTSGGGKFANTQPLPPIPTPPSNLVLASVGSDSDSIVWNDNSSNETTFDVQKSVGTNTLFSSIGTVAGSNGAKGGYKDLGLFAHTDYFYRVRSRNVAGSSAFSNVLQVTTTNSSPVISPLDTFALRFDETKIFPITASDADGDPVFIEGINLPDFVSLFDYGDGTAELFIEPTAASQGVYSNLEIRAIDGFGGSASSFFTFTVNNNHSPIIGTVTPVSLKETYILKTVVTASDADADVIQWELSNLPSFITYTTSTDGDSLRLTIAPQEVHAGTYSIGLKVFDSQDNYSLGSLDVLVEEFNPAFFVRANFGGATNGPAPWNNISVPATTGGTAAGVSFPNLVKQDGGVTGIGITLQTSWTGAETTGGVPTGFTGGVYPTSVMTSDLFTGPSNDPELILISGLNPNNKYNFDIFAGRNTTGDRRTIFTIGAQSFTVDAGRNTTQLVKFTNLVPNANGEITLSVKAAAAVGTSSASGCINAMVIESFFDGVLPPATPTNFVADYSESGNIQLTWTDNAHNEVGYEVYRSLDGASFSKIATTAPTVGSGSTAVYEDETTTPFTTYYYTVRGFNGNGNSAFTDTLSIDGLNKAPVIANIPLIAVGAGSTKNVNFSATDPEGGTISFILDGAPSWVSMVDNGNGTGTLTLTPQAGDDGEYDLSLIAMDDYGFFDSKTIHVSVSFSETFVYVNFTQSTPTSTSAPAPWNNWAIASTGTPAAPAQNNLPDHTGVATTIDIASLSGSNWSGSNLLGDAAGTLYPANATKSAWFSSNSAGRTFIISGLKPENLYDFEIFASRVGVAGLNCVFTATGANSKTGNHNAGNNTNVTTKLVALRANASGQINLQVTRGSGNTSNIYINTLIIREYVDSGLPTTPTNLTTNVLSRNSIKLDWIDQSSTETGFEIYRSVNNNTSYSLLTTTAADAQTFTDNGLTQNTSYYYKVRAKVDASTFSGYSNEASGRTFVSSVSINFGAVNLAPAPWNNISNLLAVPGDRVNNLIDDLGTNSGMSLVIVEPFIDDNLNGMNTGNNSGIVPDAVMESAWWNDPGATATIRIEGLSFLNSYNFGFFPSRNGGGNRNTTFTIGAKSVTVNAAYNISTIGQIKDVTPDANGAITFSVKAAEGSTFAYLNGLIIQASTLPSPTPEAREAEAARAAEVSETENDIVVHPNPFTNHVTITVESQKEIAQVALLTANGSAVYSEMEVKESAREHYVDFTNVNLNSGMYYMKVKFRDGSNRTVKLLRK